MALLDDLGTYLQTQGIGTVGTNLFKGLIPEDTPSGTQDALVALIQVPGLPPLRSHDSPPSRIRQPVVQVLARGAPYGYAAAQQKAEEAWQALDGVGNQVLGSTAYLFIQALQDPFFLKLDDAARPLIAFNVRVMKA